MNCDFLSQFVYLDMFCVCSQVIWFLIRFICFIIDICLYVRTGLNAYYTDIFLGLMRKDMLVFNICKFLRWCCHVVLTGSSGDDVAGCSWRFGVEIDPPAVVPLGFCRWHCIVSEIQSHCTSVWSKKHNSECSWVDVQIFSKKNY